MGWLGRVGSAGGWGFHQTPCLSALRLSSLVGAGGWGRPDWRGAGGGNRVATGDRGGAVLRLEVGGSWVWTAGAGLAGVKQQSPTAEKLRHKR